MSEKKVVQVSDVSLGHIPGTKVLLDGVDISNACYRAEVYEDGTGKAFCYKHRLNNGKMMPYVDETGQDVAREELEGKVEIVLP